MANTKSTAAQAKASKGVSVMVKNKKFTLTEKLPFRFLRAAQREDLDEIVSILLGGEQAEVFWNLDLTIEEGTEAVGKLVEKAGASLGES